MFKCVNPLILLAKFNATISNHPIRLGLPVVVPYSYPIALKSSAKSPNNSVGYGPLPTLVVYALATPMMVSNLFGAKPRPEHTPPKLGFDEVTNGYVPKSKSNIVAFAPSTKIFFLSACAWLTISTVSAMNGKILSRIFPYRSISASTSYSNPSNRFPASAANAFNFSANVSMFLMSPTRIPFLVAFDAYAGPIPLFVVPIMFPLNSASRNPSTSLCNSNNKCARSETIILPAQSTPTFSNASSSSNIPGKWTTTPLPTTHRAFLFKIPDGTKCNAYFFPSSS
mmetsp:Transcript_3781/g.13442  ORF Transcript_3781/g.13442 Transcript_3781/m.13442 type:complete len:283 (+) Transcript_3781:2685-3533(+)